MIVHKTSAAASPSTKGKGFPGPIFSLLMTLILIIGVVLAILMILIVALLPLAS